MKKALETIAAITPDRPTFSGALFLRGWMHQMGQGGPVDYPKAIALYEAAIKLDDVDAMTNRAYMHAHGQGRPVDYPKAIALYEAAIKLGNASAMTERALMHREGQGGPVDYPRYIMLLEHASRLNHQKSLNLLKHSKINKNHAIALLSLIWEELVNGNVFTKYTINALKQYCIEEIVKQINHSELASSLMF